MRMMRCFIAVMLMCCMYTNAYAASLNAEIESMMGFTESQEALASVSVALIDTGVETKYIDENRVLSGENYVSEKNGDEVGHGTRIASLILGAAYDDECITDLAPNASVVPLVYYTKYSSGVPMNGGVEAICSGIYDAVDKYGCRVIIISSGITYSDADLEAAVRYAEEHNVIVISAAGNEGNNVLYYPASVPTVIGVGSVDKNLVVSEFSQRNEGVMVAAIGEDLYAASIKNGIGFEEISGTSYACAYVGALAARLLGLYPDMTPGQFRWLIQNTATDLGDLGYDAQTGFGLINAKQAVSSYEEICQTEPLPFNDVYLSSWFYNSVLQAYESGLMTGTTQNTFAPNTNITRAMMVTVLWRMENKPAVDYLMTFEDIENGSYYEEAARWANSVGVVKGYSAESFGPNDLITREQIATIMLRYAEHKGTAPTGAWAIRLDFADIAEISDYAVEGVMYCKLGGLMQGKENNNFAPKAYATRAEIAAILHRFMKGNENTMAPGSNFDRAIAEEFDAPSRIIPEDG